jgi:hypothetical protein
MELGSFKVFYIVPETARKVKLKAFHKPLILKDNLSIFGICFAPG